MTKKILALALALMMICTCMISVNAVDALAAVNDHGYTLPEGWVEVNSSNTEMVKFFDADGNDVTADIAAVENNDTVVASRWKVFKGDGVGHLRGKHAVDTNGAGATVEFTFVGTDVAMLTQFTNTKTASPAVECYIDGELVETLDPQVYAVDNFDGGAHIKCRVHFQKLGLAEGKHTLKMVAVDNGDFGVNAFAYVPCELPEDAPATGDATITAIAIAAVASMGAALVIGKKR